MLVSRRTCVIAKYLAALQETGISKELAVSGNCGQRRMGLTIPRSHPIGPCANIWSTLGTRRPKLASNLRYRRLIRPYVTHSGHPWGAGVLGPPTRKLLAFWAAILLPLPFVFGIRWAVVYVLRGNAKSLLNVMQRVFSMLSYTSCATFSLPAVMFCAP